jgi:hypothetical protein
MGNPENVTIEAETWTPKLVREKMIEAVRWTRYNVGPTGPAPIRSTMPDVALTLEDHLAAGWGIPERADGSEDEVKVVRLPVSPETVDEMVWVLDWCRLYLIGEHANAARILNLWLRCKVYKKNFDAALKARGSELSRAHAYRLRDRALSVISQRLAAEGYRP